MAAVTVSRILRILSATMFIGCSYPLTTSQLNYTPGVSYRYEYVTSTVLNEETDQLHSSITSSNHQHHPHPHPHHQQQQQQQQGETAAQRDVGFKLSANVDVTPVWMSNSGVIIVKLEMSDARLASESRSDEERELRSLGHHPTYFQWENGHVVRVFLSDDDTTFASNVKKGVVDLFQLRLDDGPHTEVDISGECHVTYQRLDEAHLSKVKTSCRSLYAAGRFQQVNQLLGVNVTSSVRTDYVISGDNIIQTATTHESWTARVNMDRRLTAVTQTRQQLTYKESSRKYSVMEASSVDELMKQLKEEGKSGFYGSSLESTFERQSCITGKCPTLDDLVSRYRTNLLSTKTGSLAATEAFTSLLQSFRSATTEDILSVLRDPRNREILLSLIDVASAEQTAVSHSALMNIINFDDVDDIERAERYLLATALSTHPTEATLKHLLALFRKNVVNEKLRESVGEALGAVVNTYQRMQGRATHQIVSDVETALTTKLSACGSSTDCRLAATRSLGNARLPGTINTLVDLAVTSRQASVSEAALNSLIRFDAHVILNSPLVQKSVRDIFYQSYRGYDSSVRSQALKLMLSSSSSLSDDDVADIAAQSTDPWNSDYSLYIQARLFDAAQRNQTIRDLVKPLLRDVKFANYDVLAPKGKSLAFTSSFAESADVESTYHMYVENSRLGIMKRSGMDIDLISDVQTLPIYSFKLFAAGLEGLLGDEAGDEDEEEVTAGLGLDLIDVSLRPITFFVGQTGLMSALWNAPAELTPALQTNVLLQDHSERLHLTNGLIAELDVLGAFSLALDGSLSVSLWNKNAHSLIKNSGSIQLTGGLSIITDVLHASLQFNVTSQSFIDFTTDVDFYDGVVMCLRMGRPDFHVRTEVRRSERCRGFNKAYQSRVSRSSKVNAMSYPLPRRNHDNCRKLIPA